MTLNSERVRHRLDNWRFWMGVAYFGLVLVVVALWLNWSRVSADAARRHADIVANADAQYQQCINSIPTLTHVNLFISGIEEVEQALLTNMVMSHRATPPGSRLYTAQSANIVRLRAAILSAQQVAFPIPTGGKCLALRDRLDQQS